ncbi:MAG: Txe/YoeB family addiction module toxin [Oscillospiraceae bacterium]|jgi:Txe/YoeB family toxin of toxin-antitoxin system|nr:Txe/YoeB family addiction module toxin [Oscillospiraceae bacterium]
MYKLIYTSQAKHDWKIVKRSLHRKTVNNLLEIVKRNPLEYPPEFEYLLGNMDGAISRRINKKHRFVYEILPNSDSLTNETGAVYDGIVKIISMWNHYE